MEYPDGVVNASAKVADDRAEGGELDYWHGVVTSADAPAGLEAMAVAAGTWGSSPPPVRSRRPSSTCGEMCSPCGSRPTRIAVVRVRRSPEPASRRMAPRRNLNCGFRLSRPDR